MFILFVKQLVLEEHYLHLLRDSSHPVFSDEDSTTSSRNSEDLTDLPLSTIVELADVINRGPNEALIVMDGEIGIKSFCVFLQKGLVFLRGRRKYSRTKLKTDIFYCGMCQKKSLNSL